MRALLASLLWSFAVSGCLLTAPSREELGGGTTSSSGSGGGSTLSTACGTPKGKAYYVSPNGSDAASGESPSEAWQTVKRVNTAHIGPGDTVFFEGSNEFADAYLQPSSGTKDALVAYCSYGSGQANLSQGIFQTNQGYFAIENLAVEGAEGDPQKGGGVSGFQCGSAAGCHDIVVRSCSFKNVLSAVQLSNDDDHDVVIEHNVIVATGETAILVLKGSNIQIVDNSLSNTGLSTANTNWKHGIGVHGDKVQVRGNTIESFGSNGQAISLNGSEALVESNVIHGGTNAMGCYGSAVVPATTTLAFNVITDVTSGIYIDTGTAQDYVIASNTIVSASGSSGNALDLNPDANRSLTVANNIAVGGWAYQLRVTPPATFREQHNLYWVAGGTPSFEYGGMTESSLADYEAASMQGSGDLSKDPKLGKDERPLDGSPVIDAGTSGVGGSVSYMATCDGTPFSYCGSAPDLGAFESGGPTRP